MLGDKKALSQESEAEAEARKTALEQLEQRQQQRQHVVRDRSPTDTSTNGGEGWREADTSGSGDAAKLTMEISDPKAQMATKQDIEDLKKRLDNLKSSACSMM
jgi:hypothetical protein